MYIYAVSDYQNGNFCIYGYAVSGHQNGNPFFFCGKFLYVQMGQCRYLFPFAFCLCEKQMFAVAFVNFCCKSYI